MRERSETQWFWGVFLCTLVLYALALSPVFRMAAQFLGPIPLAALAVRSGVKQSLFAGTFSFLTALVFMYSAAVGFANADQVVTLFLTVIVGPAWILGYGLRRQHHGVRIVLTLAVFFLAVSFVEVLAFARTGNFSLLDQGLAELTRGQMPSWISPGETEAFRQELQRNLRLFLKLFPAVTVLSAVMQGGVLLLVAVVVFPVLGLTRPWLGRFSRWRLPVPFVWVLLAGMGVMILNTQHPLPELAEIVALNVIFFAGVLYWVQGLAVGRHFLKKSPAWVWLLAVAGAVLLPQPVAVLGVFDALYDLRSRSLAGPDRKDA